jgi:pentatricopeptide repeat protein
MKDSSNLPDMTTYTALMDGLCNEGTPQDANRLLHDILKKV